MLCIRRLQHVRAQLMPSPGAPFQWAAILHKSDMAFQNGAAGLRFYNSATKRAEHDLPCKVSCSHCGTLIMDEGRNMVLLFPTLLSLDEEQRRNFEVQYALLYLLVKCRTEYASGATSSTLSGCSTSGMGSQSGQDWMKSPGWWKSPECSLREKAPIVRLNRRNMHLRLIPTSPDHKVVPRLEIALGRAPAPGIQLCLLAVDVDR